MSVTRVQLVGNVSAGASFVGVVTATSFSGSGANLTGIAATDNVRTNSLVVSGVSTLGTVVVGGATTQLIVVGDARVTGILTVGSASITLDGTNNRINVGTGLTLSSSGVNVTGVITATSFVGSGANLTGIANTANIVSTAITTGTLNVTTSAVIGSAVTINSSGINVTGIITATSINVPPVPITFSPANGATGVALNSNIIITFNGTVAIGTGNITLRSNSAGGTAFSTIGVSSSSVTISGGAVTIDPPANIGTATTTFVVVDAGAFSGLTTTSVNNIINTYSFTTVPLSLSSIVPANAATDVAVSTNITLTFNGPPTRGTGTITLRSGSTSGTVIESFDAASSGRISISGNVYTIDPTSNLGFSTSIHTIIPSTAITGYVGLNTTGADTHSFTTIPDVVVGASYEGGFLICKASPLRWVVSPFSAQVTRTWDLRNDANTRAQQVSGCTGWFVPTCGQLQNPGYLCRSFWGPSPCYSSGQYWSSTEFNAPRAFCVNFVNGTAVHGYPKSYLFNVRAFRCVTY